MDHSYDPVQHILEKLDNPKETGAGRWSARCPAHEDDHPSLSVCRGDDGRALLHCHAGCETKAIVKALGLRMRDLFTREPRRLFRTYDYRSTEGELLFQSVRYVPKEFSQRRPDSKGGWIWNLDDTPRVLYRLPELLAADPETLVFVVEGEKDADNLVQLGLVATTNPQGAGKWKLLDDDSALHDRQVAVMQDRDDVGRRHAQDVAKRLTGKAAEVRIVAVPEFYHDVSEWIESRDSVTPEELREQLLQAVQQAPVCEQPATRIVEAEPDAEPEADDAEEDLVPLGSRDPESDRIVLSPKRTMPTAEAFVGEFYAHRHGRTLHHYAGLLLSWRDNRYVQAEDNLLRHKLQPWLHQALRYVRDRGSGVMKLVDFDSNSATIGSALDSIKAFTHLPASITPPAWLAELAGMPKAREVLPCKEINLHIPSGIVFAPTPALFTVNALDFDFQAKAQQPARWLQFLDQLFSTDREQIELLQEWFGYCLTTDTSLQKMLLMVGPRRSGKGTIARVLGKLVGAGNVCGPTTSSLAGQFGLQPLIGKGLAIVSDARFAGDSISTVVERLLCISGEDTLTVDRKFLESVTMKLPVKFMFLTNELPFMADASAALAGRFMLLRLTRSFYGDEDVQLTERLCAELPGILNWALDGWKRLHLRGRFVQPVSVADAVRDMEDLASPVLAFVRECCDVGTGQRVLVDSLYQAWKDWCEQDGRSSVTTKQRFGRDLGAAVPSVACRRGACNARFYEGIGLKPPSSFAA